jgi:hypothetical protein
VSPIQPLSRESFDVLKTHDCTFTRGLQAGYVKAMVESRTAFCSDFLTSQIGPLTRLLEGSGADWSVGPAEVRLYGVSWVRMSVSFPEGD